MVEALRSETACPCTLAAIPNASDLLTVFLWFAVAAVLVAAGFVAALAVRRWTQREQSVVSFTFQDLREMRSRGDITDAEFAAMRAALLGEMNADERTGASGVGEEGAAQPGDDN